MISSFVKGPFDAPEGAMIHRLRNAYLDCSTTANFTQEKPRT